jgi:hypothetical protein
MPQTCKGYEAFKSFTCCANESFSSQPTLSLELFERRKCAWGVKTHHCKMATMFVSIWLTQKSIHPLALEIRALQNLVPTYKLLHPQRQIYRLRNQIHCLVFRKEYSSALPITLMLEPPRTTLLMRIWAKQLVRCLLWRYSKHFHHRGMPYSLP